MTIREGDIVSIRPGSVYYDGMKEILPWVQAEHWIVASVNGDRAVINKNVSGTKEIHSPVNVACLIVETQESRNQSKDPSPAPPADRQPTKISERGVKLIAKYEGCQLKAYKCPAGVWTIGYGHTEHVKAGDILPSKEAAMELLKADLDKYAGYVRNCIKNGKIGFPLNQNQFDALTSFVYNCGSGSLQKLVTGRDAATIAQKMLQYNKGGGRVLPGLVRRRQEEHDLFLS